MRTADGAGRPPEDEVVPDPDGVVLDEVVVAAVGVDDPAPVLLLLLAVIGAATLADRLRQTLHRQNVFFDGNMKSNLSRLLYEPVKLI